MKIYAAMYTSCAFMFEAKVISLHRTKEGAERAAESFLAMDANSRGNPPPFAESFAKEFKLEKD